jgi:hypothetical protein
VLWRVGFVPRKQSPSRAAGVGCLASKEARPAPGLGSQKHGRIWNYPHSLAAQSCYGNYFWQLLLIKGNRF